MAAKSRTRKRAAKSNRSTRGAAKADGAAAVAQALAVFAHEVRTPLTGIRALTDLLVTSDLPERERRWVDTIRASADHLASLATVFVDGARSRTAGLVLRDDVFDLQALARATADSLAGRAAAKGLRAETRLAAKLPGLVSGDPVRLRAALENLIDNAVKFTERGRVRLVVTAMPIDSGAPSTHKRGKARRHANVKATKASAADVLVSFVVSDSGIGLSAADIARLFRPFGQASDAIAARYGGAGLGLASVREIARAMGGDVTAHRGRSGASFTLTVALTRAQAVRADGAEGPMLPQRPLQVLSVEDNPFGRVVLKSVLTELGHSVEFVGTGADALARLRDGNFDAVLMDMVLPDIGGVEVIRRIRRSRGPARQVRLIGVSGRGEEEKAARAAGADDFLMKPVSPRVLALALAADPARPAQKGADAAIS